MALSTENKAAIQTVIDLMVKQNAPELPFDSGLIERLALVSASIGFASTGNFIQQARDNPISTLLRFAKFIGT